MTLFLYFCHCTIYIHLVPSITISIISTSLLHMKQHILHFGIFLYNDITMILTMNGMFNIILYLTQNVNLYKKFPLSALTSHVIEQEPNTKNFTLERFCPLRQNKPGNEDWKDHRGKTGRGEGEYRREKLTADNF